MEAQDTVTVIRPLSPDEEPQAVDLLDAALGGRHQARLGELVDVLGLAGFGAWTDDALIGLATYLPDGERTELVALAVAEDQRLKGVGGSLVEAVAAAAAHESATELWLVTTNDNLDALRLYQRHGFRLVELHAGNLDRSRALKPSIPAIGQHGIPLRDELVLARPLGERWSGPLGQKAD